MIVEKKWYLVCLKERSEKKVIDLLDRKKIENYLPLTRVKKEHTGKNSALLYRPLFDRLLFVHLEAHEIDIVKQTDGVSNFLYWLNTYAVISSDDIRAIRIFLSVYSNVRYEKIPLSGANMNGLTDGKEFETGNSGIPGKVEKILLPSLGYFLLGQAETEKAREEILHQAI